MVYWSATRGEGGQNRVSGYQVDSLGICHTWERLADRKLDGGECLFGPFVDFRFSKDADAIFAGWNRDLILGNLCAPYGVCSRRS